ncbi:serine/threonine protein kinase [Kribbella amoyensis]|uniref:Serine/threonine protein kinase n=1 Tax=Kribbella amoyensis TaxID=996641 RepID=A0A561BQ18_9ACTN|nr:serine/threonine-protein kinase [Kribbella amoyensis]TWD80985.1 serine/threonine protein kinase [Kribbella amoyensis]
MQHEDSATIGPFVVRSRLGRGAMGAVYLAKSPGGRLVAVKVVRDELAGDDRFRARFAREIEHARKVSGAFTAAVVDADPAADRPWLATEYLPGPTLQQAVDEHGPLERAGLRYVVAGLAEALLAIHRCGLVHRDLKPSNILLTDNGPRVIDFGIARALEDVSLTATGNIIGTPGYLSPEQITGGTVGPASDLFSLGAVLAFAATGRGPFGTGPVGALVHRVVHEQPTIPALPDGLEDLTRRCLTIRPDARPTPQQILDTLGPVDPTGMPAANTLLAPHPVPPTKVEHRPQPLPAHLQAPPPPQHLPSGPTNPHQPPALQRITDAAPGTTFGTTRTRPAIIAVIALAFALLCGLNSQYASEANQPLLALAWLVPCFVAWWYTITRTRLVLRRRVRLRVAHTGLTVHRGSRSGTAPWSSVARIRITGDQTRPWLVVWFEGPADLPASARRHHGGARIYPIGHERAQTRRTRQLTELQAALTWYAGRLYDRNP